MQADFVASRVMHGVNFSLDLQHVPFEKLEVSRVGKSDITKPVINTNIHCVRSFFIPPPFD
jgi:hypothetical protein